MKTSTAYISFTMFILLFWFTVGLVAYSITVGSFAAFVGGILSMIAYGYCLDKAFEL